MPHAVHQAHDAPGSLIGQMWATDQMRSRIRFLIAAAKVRAKDRVGIDSQIVALQVGPDLGSRVTFLLLVLALVEIRWDKWLVSVASTGIYLAVTLGRGVVAR